jgi:hypothetical protein
MKKIKVPEGMLKAGRKAWMAWKVAACYDTDALVPIILEDALGWLLEGNNLPLPSIADDRYQGPEWETGWNLAVDAVRRMFLAPEPEGIEVSKEMLEYINKNSEAASYMNAGALVEIVRTVEAYRRGQTQRNK